jgi:predicted NBD/HSP70 family sugar kinase
MRGTDHWEAYCSGNGMPEMAAEVFDADFESSVDVFEKFQKGDKDARRAIAKMQSYNASGFANVVNVFNPEVVWIGGAVALNHYDTVVEEVCPRSRTRRSTTCLSLRDVPWERKQWCTGFGPRATISSRSASPR